MDNNLSKSLVDDKFLKSAMGVGLRDLVRVVRCRDCKWNDGQNYCTEINQEVEDFEFCSRGELDEATICGGLYDKIFAALLKADEECRSKRCEDCRFYNFESCSVWFEASAVTNVLLSGGAKNAED